MSTTGIEFPINFPISFTAANTEFAFPLTFPMKFSTSKQYKKTLLIPITCTAYTDIYHGKTNLIFTETAIGKTKKIKFTEKAWWFPGLFIEENVIKTIESSVNITESVQSLILADFELLSSNEVKVKWYGDTVPKLTVMKKPDSEELYTKDNTYPWDTGEATVKLTNEDYNIYLLGTSNSGSSAVYTIGGIVDAVAVPAIDVILNEKIYDLNVEYTGVYYLTIEY